MAFEYTSLKKTQAVLEQFLKAHEEGDVATQHHILMEFIEREQIDYQRKLKYLAELKTLKQEVRAARGTIDRVARLIALFRFAAPLMQIGFYDLCDKETEETAVRSTHDAGTELKAIGPEGMAALVELLRDPSIDVRGSACSLLLEDMPQRVIPVIEEIEREAPGSDANMRTQFSLLYYQTEATRQV
jgi:hypothetical protein